MRAPTGLILILSVLVAITETVAGSETVTPSSPLKWGSCTATTDTDASSDTDTDDTGIEFPSEPVSTLATPTRSPTSSLIECATLTVPVCYDGANSCSKGRNMTQTLRVSRLTTATAADAPTLWIAQDTLLTSQSAGELMTRITQHVTSNVNVYALESRLFSNVFTPNNKADKPTPCASMVADFGTRPIVDSGFVTAQAACKAWIQSSFGDDGINAYSLESAAQDLALAISTVQSKGGSTSGTFVYASGRATRVVQRMLSQAKAETTVKAVTVTGVILDSPLPTPAAEKPVADASNRFVSACATDAQCKFRFSDASLTDVIKQIYAQMDNNTATNVCVAKLKDIGLTNAGDPTASHGVRRLLAKIRRATSIAGPQLVPVLMYKVRRCTSAIQGTLLTALSKVSDQFPMTTQDAAANMAAFVDAVVTASELWPTSPEPTREQLTTDFRASLMSDGLLLQQQPSVCAYSASQSTACQALYKPGVASALNSSLSLVYKPSATATDTSVFSGIDVAILASRLSTMGSSPAATQLYDSLLSQKRDGQTLVMVQSDQLTETELTSDLTDAELRLLSQFLSSNARGLSGSWLSSDLTAFDWSTTPPSTGKAKSSLTTTPSTVNLIMSSTDSYNWFSWSDPYRTNLEYNDGGETADADSEFHAGPVRTIVMWVGFPSLALAVVFFVWRRCKSNRVSRRQRHDPPQPLPAAEPLAIVVYPTPAPVRPQPPLQPSQSFDSCGLQPQQWRADQANEYALSYTPRDRNGRTAT